MSYASAKGRTAPLFEEKNRKPLPALSDEEKEVIAEKARLVKQFMPEFWDSMKVLQAEGMIDGMRCIESVTVFERVDHGSDS